MLSRPPIRQRRFLAHTNVATNNYIFVLPLSCSEELSPILYVLPLQMLAHDLSCLRGLNPDAPRGLSKATETW